MSKSIMMHPKLGANIRMCFCPRCGGDSPSLCFAGSANFKTECTSCHTTNYGSSPRDKCGACKEIIGGKRIELTEFERVPGELCEDCEEQIEVVKAGGIFFRCELGCLGAIKASEQTAQFRSEHGIAAPKPVAIQFTTEQCPNRENHK